MKGLFKEQIDNGLTLTKEMLKGVSKECFDDGNTRPFKPGEICLTFLVKEDGKAIRIECTSNKCLDNLNKHFKLETQSRVPILRKLT